MLEKSSWSGKRGPRKKLSIENVIVLNIIRFIFHIKDLKAFHKMATELKIVDGMPSYANFVKATNSCLEIMEMFLAYLLTMGRGMNATGIHYIDSTPLTVCLSMRIREYRGARGAARCGKSTKGWFYGVKLHGICSSDGRLASVLITDGSVHDSSVVEELTRGMTGLFFCDAGYLKKAGGWCYERYAILGNSPEFM